MYCSQQVVTCQFTYLTVTRMTFSSRWTTGCMQACSYHCIYVKPVRFTMSDELQPFWAAAVWWSPLGSSVWFPNTVVRFAKESLKKLSLAKKLSTPSPSPRRAEPTAEALLPSSPHQLSDMQTCLYLLWFHYPGSLFWHLNFSVAY